MTKLPKPSEGGSLLRWALPAWKRIQELTPIAGVGVKIRRSPQGFVISVDSPRGGRASVPFQVTAVRYDAESETYTAQVGPGWLLNIDPAESFEPEPDPLPDPYTPTPAAFMGYHMPVIMAPDPDSTEAVPLPDKKQPMNVVPSAEIEWTDGDKIALRVQTDDRDIVKFDETTGDPLVEIVAVSEGESGTHSQPEDPEQPGVDGDYYYTLATFEVDKADPAVVTIRNRHHGGPIHHRPNLRTFVNKGAGPGPFIQRNREDDSEEFRGIRGDHGIGTTKEAEDIKVDFDGDNIGGGTPIYAKPGDDPLIDGSAEFRTLADNAIYGAEELDVKWSLADDGGDPATLTGEVLLTVKASKANLMCNGVSVGEVLVPSGQGDIDICCDCSETTEVP